MDKVSSGGVLLEKTTAKSIRPIIAPPGVFTLTRHFPGRVGIISENVRQPPSAPPATPSGIRAIVIHCPVAAS